MLRKEHWDGTRNNIENKETKEIHKQKKSPFERVEKSQRHRTCALADSAGVEPAKQPLLEYGEIEMWISS